MLIALDKIFHSIGSENKNLKKKKNPVLHQRTFEFVEVMSNMEKCGQSKSDQIDHQKSDESNRNHPANKKDESKFLLLIDFHKKLQYFLPRAYILPKNFILAHHSRTELFSIKKKIFP